MQEALLAYACGPLFALCLGPIRDLRGFKWPLSPFIVHVDYFRVAGDTPGIAIAVGQLAI